MRVQTRLVWLMLRGGLCSGEAAAPLNHVLFNRTCRVGPVPNPCFGVDRKRASSPSSSSSASSWS
eukprot:7513331-Pyramimonas_sp.AAC.1